MLISVRAVKVPKFLLTCESEMIGPWGGLVGAGADDITNLKLLEATPRLRRISARTTRAAELIRISEPRANVLGSL